MLVVTKRDVLSIFSNLFFFFFLRTNLPSFFFDPRDKLFLQWRKFREIFVPTLLGSWRLKFCQTIICLNSTMLPASMKESTLQEDNVFRSFEIEI